MHALDGTAIWRASRSETIIRLLGEWVAGLIEDHGFVVFLPEEFEQVDLFIEFPQSSLQPFVFSLKLSELFAIEYILASVVDLRVRVFEIYLFMLALLLYDLEIGKCHFAYGLFHGI